MQPLPIDSYLPEIVGHARRSRAVVVTAEPGAGKTTRVPPALVEDGPLMLLQPRRVAARAMAQRIADERGWTVGREIGWQIRFDKRFSASTRLLVVTEGVLTRVLQRDPLLVGVHHDRARRVSRAERACRRGDGTVEAGVAGPRRLAARGGI